MAAARRHKRVAASQPGFLPLKSDADNNNNNDGGSAKPGRRKRVSKNKKKNWNKYSDVQDVEEFLEDVRLQERATGWVRLLHNAADLLNIFNMKFSLKKSLEL